jgi:hypothetical protein
MSSMPDPTLNPEGHPSKPEGRLRFFVWRLPLDDFRLIGRATGPVELVAAFVSKDLAVSFAQEYIEGDFTDYDITEEPDPHV